MAIHQLVVRSFCTLVRLQSTPHAVIHKGPFIATQINSTQLNSTRQREQQLTQFVGRDVINKTRLTWLYAVQLGQLSSVELYRYKHPLTREALLSQRDRTMLSFCQ